MEICSHFGICGGCSVQNLEYDEQLGLKEKLVRENLGDLPVLNFYPILPSPEKYFYRNKMEFSFGNDGDRVYLGLHPKKRFDFITPTPTCLLLSEESQNILKIVSDWATDNKIEPYYRGRNDGILRHLVIREGKNTGERLVNLVTTSKLQSVDSLTHSLKGPNGPTFIWTIHDGLSDVARGDETRVLSGEGFIREKVGGIFVRVPHSSFMQTNTHASEKMIEVLRGWVKQDVKAKTLFDLYCGAGTIGLNLVEFFERLVGVEVDEAATSEARYNAVYNGILNAEFVAGKVEELTWMIKGAGPVEDTTVVVDPPRMGLHAKAVESLLEAEVPRLYYVSCNPQSLARDLRFLSAKYTIEAVQPMDFFPHTDHVETAVKLKRT